jgi:hypothetical protein
MVAPHCVFFASNALAESPTTIRAPTILVWQQSIRFFTTTFVTVASLLALALEKPWPTEHVELVMFVHMASLTVARYWPAGQSFKFQQMPASFLS